MRSLFTFPLLCLLVIACGKEAAVVPLDGPVASLSDLPTTYQPFTGGNAVAGRLKSEGQGGKPGGEWRYNERGQLVEWRHFRFGELAGADQYRYDAAGHLRFVQHFDNNCRYSSSLNCSGSVLWTSYDELTTDAAGRIAQSRTYLKIDGQWTLRSTSTYKYDGQGQLVSVLRSADNDVVTFTQTLTYDERGNVISVREQNSGGSPDYADRTFRYDYDTGLNPYRNTVYYASALFLSRNTQIVAGQTYEYRSDGQPSRIRQNGGVWELTYY